MNKAPLDFKPLPAPRVEIINLIDVLITLIAFFLLTTVFAESRRQIGVVLPSVGQSSPVNLKVSRLEVELDRNGRMFCDGRWISEGELPELLKQQAKSTIVILKADKDCDYQSVISLLDVVKQYRLTKVALEVRRH